VWRLAGLYVRLSHSINATPVFSGSFPVVFTAPPANPGMDSAMEDEKATVTRQTLKLLKRETFLRTGSLVLVAVSFALRRQSQNTWKVENLFALAHSLSKKWKRKQSEWL